MNSFGVFPFGRPNTARPARIPNGSTARVTVVGVYPSAWHISWRAPAYLASDGRSGSVAAMAVDVEPMVFWNGDDEDFGRSLATWVEETGFVQGGAPGEHGTISPTSPSTNGSSGAKVEKHYLEPLGLSAREASFTDVYPVFVVKRNKRGGLVRRREQGDAISTEYDPIAESLGFPQSSLPDRPSAKTLVRQSLEQFRGRLIADVETSNAPLVLTLGDEALQVVRGVSELKPSAPAESLTDLYGSAYGRSGSLEVNGRRVEWLALAHPGLLKGAPTTDDVDPAKRSVPGWNRLHSDWQVRVGRTL
jgi:hypothetical protein